MPQNIRISQFPSIASQNILGNFYVLAVRRDPGGMPLDNVKITLDQIIDIIEVSPEDIVIPNGTPDDLTLVTENGQLVLKAYSGGGSSTLAGLTDVEDSAGVNKILLKTAPDLWVATDLDISLIPSITVNRTGTTFTTDATWAGRYNRLITDGDKTLTLSNLGLPINAEFHINLLSTGNLQINTGSDASLIINPNITTFESGSVLTIKRVSGNTFDIIGTDGSGVPLDISAEAISFSDPNTGLESDNVGDALRELQIQKISVAGAIFPFVLNVTDDTTPIVTDSANVYSFRMPLAFYLTEVSGSLSIAQTSGSTFQFSVEVDQAPVSTTPYNIENTQFFSADASLQPDFTPMYIEKGALVTINIEQVGDGTAAGLKVYLLGHRIEIGESGPILPPPPVI